MLGWVCLGKDRIDEPALFPEAKRCLAWPSRHFNQENVGTPLQYRFHFRAYHSMWFWQYSGNVPQSWREIVSEGEVSNSSSSIQQQQLRGPGGAAQEVLTTNQVAQPWIDLVK